MTFVSNNLAIGNCYWETMDIYTATAGYYGD